MNDLELATLYTQIGRFLVEATPESRTPDVCLERGRAFWSSRPHITAAEMGILADLVLAPASVETVACRLERDLADTQAFLDALVVVGMLECIGNDYGATAPARVYLETFTDHPTKEHERD